MIHPPHPLTRKQGYNLKKTHNLISFHVNIYVLLFNISHFKNAALQ